MMVITRVSRDGNCRSSMTQVGGSRNNQKLHGHEVKWKATLRAGEARTQYASQHYEL